MINEAGVGTAKEKKKMEKWPLIRSLHSRSLVFHRLRFGGGFRKRESGLRDI